MANPFKMMLSRKEEFFHGGLVRKEMSREFSLYDVYKMLYHSIEYDSPQFEDLGMNHITYSISARPDSYTTFSHGAGSLIAERIRYTLSGDPEILRPILEFLYNLGYAKDPKIFGGEFPRFEQRKPTWLIGLLLSRFCQLYHSIATDEIKLLNDFGINIQLIEDLKKNNKAGIIFRIFDANEYWFLDPEQPIENLIRIFVFT